MTPTKRCLVEIDDILGVQYECRNCHAATVVPIKKLRDARQTSLMFVAQCQYCQTPWGFQPKEKMHEFLENLTSYSEM
jgi:hypothetical protein